MHPYFSIIVPAYNRAHFLPAVIKSVLGQTRLDWELIIVDDASTDNTGEVIASFTDNRIIYLRNERNCERGFSRNRGISESSGKYICFLDSDDEFLENHLEVLYKNIADNGEAVALFFTKSYQRFGDQPMEKRYFEPIEKHNIFKYILTHTFNHNCVAVHRAIFDEFRYDPEIPGLEDLDLWLHIALKYPVISINEYTNVLNFHEASYTHGDYYRFEKELRNFRRIFSKKEFKNVLPLIARWRLISMCHYQLAVRYELEKKTGLMYRAILRSFFFYPPGYNRKTNLPLFVMSIYHIPLLGGLIRAAVRKLKR
jgi:glycosyltransferase involved in cell wall biosynthesis